MTAQTVLADPSETRAKLDHVFARLDRAITTSQVAAALVDGGVSAAAANSGAVALLTPDRQQLVAVYSVGDELSQTARTRVLPVEARFPLCDVVRSRQEIWLTGAVELAERYPTMQPSDGSSAWAALPLQ